MKFFYKHFTQRVIMFFLLIGITVSSATILNSWAIHEEFTPTEEVPPIPSWIKKTVGWWAYFVCVIREISQTVAAICNGTVSCVGFCVVWLVDMGYVAVFLWAKPSGVA